MDIYAEMVEKIIQEQENIIGPVALEQARKVSGLQFDLDKHQVILEGNKMDILEKLVRQYQHLFGQASVEVCKDAVKGIVEQVPKDQIPQILL